jgi:signal transduction histidine kinase
MFGLPPQVVFSCGLMLSSFKGMDCRREGVMRQIQESHRQTLIQELKRVIEQKDAFMSSVSHELRTPLNGIIGEVAQGVEVVCEPRSAIHNLVCTSVVYVWQCT